MTPKDPKLHLEDGGTVPHGQDTVPMQLTFGTEEHYNEEPRLKLAHDPTKDLHSGHTLYEALMAEGFTMPDNVTDVELVIPVEGILALKYTELLSSARLAQLGRAMIRLAAIDKERTSR